jgi:hypothetical protein
MKNIPLVLSLFFFILLFSCKNDQEAKDPSHEETTVDSTSADTKTHEVVIPVTLDRGQKWIADAETTRKIEIMKGLLSEFPSNPTEADYRALHKKLITGFQSILQKCTMTGEARSQLQNYLTPLKKMIDTMETGNLETCNSTFSDLHVYLLRYSHYFF